MSTALHKRTIEFDYGDADRRDLMEKVWSATPWMVEVETGNINSETERAIIEWCRNTFGDEAWPIHGRPGDWQRGSATIYGWTFFGFKTQAQMGQFMERFPYLVKGDGE